MPGPDEEVNIVREIFQMYISKLYSPADIAEILNARGVPWIYARPWTRQVIREMVTNPKYTGCNVTNRRSGRLRAPRKGNPREMWIKKENAFASIISSADFERAEAVARFRGQRCTDEELIEHLRAFIREKGRMTARMIDADPEMPCSQAYRERFGSLMEAYRRIGHAPSRDISYVARDLALLPLRRRLLQLVAEVANEAGFTTSQQHHSSMLILNGEVSVRAVVARYRPLGHNRGWLVRLPITGEADFTVVARMCEENTFYSDYLCLPREFVGAAQQFTIRSDRQAPYERYRVGELRLIADIFASAIK